VLARHALPPLDLSPQLRQAAAVSKAWPFEEARKIIHRMGRHTRPPSEIIFETGYGPSGLPHIGTFGEVARTTMVRTAFRLLTRDEQYGETNKVLFGEWLSTWVPRCIAAAQALQPIWSQPADKSVTFADSLDAAKQKFRSLLEDLGLDVPKELDQ